VIGYARKTICSFSGLSVAVKLNYCQTITSEQNKSGSRISGAANLQD
jgi:hypothetical protein